MKFIKLFEQYVDDIILESFQSEIIRNAVLDTSMSAYFKKNTFAWDKIKDDDLEEVDVESAKKLARKRNETHYILWMRGNHFVAVTCGNWVVVSSADVKVNDSINKVSSYSDSTWEIKNGKSFETRELRLARTEARRNALALQDNVEIAEKNMERYKALLDQARTAGDDEVKAAFEMGLKAYETVISTYRIDVLKYLADEVKDDSGWSPYGTKYSKMNDAFMQANKAFSSLQQQFRDFGYAKSSRNRGSNMDGYYANAAREHAQELISLANSLQQMATDYAASVNQE